MSLYPIEERSEIYTRTITSAVLPVLIPHFIAEAFQVLKRYRIAQIKKHKGTELIAKLSSGKSQYNPLGQMPQTSA